MNNVRLWTTRECHFWNHTVSVTRMKKEYHQWRGKKQRQLSYEGQGSQEEVPLSRRSWIQGQEGEGQARPGQEGLPGLLKDLDLFGEQQEVTEMKAMKSDFTLRRVLRATEWRLIEEAAWRQGRWRWEKTGGRWMWGLGWETRSKLVVGITTYLMRSVPSTYFCEFLTSLAALIHPDPDSTWELS